jgi:hypothetical protein
MYDETSSCKPTSGNTENTEEERENTEKSHNGPGVGPAIVSLGFSVFSRFFSAISVSKDLL